MPTENQTTNKHQVSDGQRVSGKFAPGHKKLGGRQKGTKNRYTLLRNRILDAIELAAGKAGWKDANEYLASICKAEPINFLRIAASLLPKDLSIKSGFDPLKIILERAKGDEAEGASKNDDNHIS